MIECLNTVLKEPKRFLTEPKTLNVAKVLILGVAYKSDIDDYRESPTIDVIKILKSEGVETDFYDPYIPKFRLHGEEFVSIDGINPEVVASYDIIFITVAHTNVYYDMIQQNAKAIFDSENAMDNVKNRSNINILKFLR